MENVMRVAIGQFNQVSHERLTFAKQLGASGVLLNTPVLPGEQRWEYEDLLQLRMQVEEYGLRLEALENTPISFYDQAMLGLPGRDEQIQHYQATIRSTQRNVFSATSARIRVWSSTSAIGLRSTAYRMLAAGYWPSCGSTLTRRPAHASPSLFTAFSRPIM